jgi:hypothetical protein
VSTRGQLRRTAPWVLCAVSLGLMAAGSAARWALRDDSAVAYEEWLEGTLGAIGVAGIPVVGALIAARLPANPYGWIWCGAGLAYGVSEVSSLLRAAGGPGWVGAVLEAWGFVGFLALLVFVFLLFPTGRLPTPRWRWVTRAAVTVVVLLLPLAPFAFDPADPADASPWAQGAAGRFVFGVVVAGVVTLFGLLLSAMVSLVLRFRRAGPVERRQLTWLVYATALIASYLALDALGVVPDGWINAAVNAATLAVLPIAVGVAVFRYRLYEIDRIVSRTVTYGLLSATIVVVYVLVVALLAQLGLPEGSSDLVVAAVTLAVAGLIGPVRRRLQTAVDRRFDRARYDAARAVDAYAARLRDQVDLDEVVAGLRSTVTATVAPTLVGVWLTGPAGLRKG